MIHFDSGYNMSKAMYNDDDVADNVDVDSKGAINIGLETRSWDLILGGSFRKEEWIKFSLMGYNLEGHDTYNYAAVHLLYLQA